MSNEFSIADYGAAGDGKTLNTAAIQKAIDACHAAGGGRVWCGPGRHLTGTITLKSRVDLHLAAGCVLLGSPSLADYRDFAGEGLDMSNPSEKSCKSLIQAAGAEDLAITGPGEVNGNGLVFFDTAAWTPDKKVFGKPGTERPRLLMFHRCRRVRIEDARFVDSPLWSLWLMRCEQVHIHRIRIEGDHRMNNQDGIDFDSCRDVTVSDSTFCTGDDCLCLRAMQRYHDAPAICENVTVTNCTLESACQAIRVGCPGDNIIRNCVFSNLVITRSRNGIRFDNPHRYLRADDRQTADIHDILFENIVVDCDGIPIGLTVEEGIALRRLSDISFRHLRVRGGRPCEVMGNTQTTLRNIHFSDVRFDLPGDTPLRCRHVEGLRLDAVEFRPRTPA